MTDQERFDALYKAVSHLRDALAMDPTKPFLESMRLADGCLEQARDGGAAPAPGDADLRPGWSQRATTDALHADWCMKRPGQKLHKRVCTCGAEPDEDFADAPAVLEFCCHLCGKVADPLNTIGVCDKCFTKKPDQPADAVRTLRDILAFSLVPETRGGSTAQELRDGLHCIQRIAEAAIDRAEGRKP